MQKPYSVLFATAILAVGCIAALPPHKVESRKNASKPWNSYEAVSLDRIPGFTPKPDPALDEYGGWEGTEVEYDLTKELTMFIVDTIGE